MLTRWVPSVVLFLSLFAERSSLADNIQESKAHFQEAQKHFAFGEFEQAAQEYELAYKAKPDAAFLYNAAQAYRKANNLNKALILYQNFVSFYPDAPNLELVRSQIQRVQEAIAAEERAKQAQPGGTVAPNPHAENQVAHSPAPEQPASAVTTAPAPEKEQHKIKPWVWGVVAGGVVVVGLAIGLGVGLGMPQHSPTPSYGTWSFQ